MGHEEWVSIRDSANKLHRGNAGLALRLDLYKEVLLADLRREIYKTPPVSPEVFMLSKYYLGKKGHVYPGVLEAFCELNSGQYNRAILTGGTGSGKSTIVNGSILYQIYLLSRMHDPHKTFRLDPASEILTVIQSIDRSSAEVQYKRVRTLIEHSDYFKEKFPFDSKRKSDIIFKNRIEIIPVSGNTEAIIGRNVYQAHMNEVNFMEIVSSSKKNIDGGIYDQAWALYNSVSDRRTNRFTVRNKVNGMLYLDSSKRYPGQFTDILEREVHEDLEKYGKSETYIFDRRVWETKPEGTFTDWFFVFKGDDTRKPKVVEEEDIAKYSEDDQEKYIDKGPLVFKKSFIRDPYTTLRDAFGWSTLAKHPYIPDIESLAKCFRADHPSIFSLESAVLDTGQLTVVKTAIEAALKRGTYPRWCHIDLSRTGDATGFVVGGIDKFVKMDRGDAIEILPRIVIDGALAINPPPGGEIIFSKVRNLLYTLRDVMGLPIKWVTFDTWQSDDSEQTLRGRGFITGKQSMDKTPCVPYDITKNALCDDRVLISDYSLLFNELRGLEKDPKTGKVDHTSISTKDIADSLGAVIYRLTMRSELWIAHGITRDMMPDFVRNGGK